MIIVLYAIINWHLFLLKQRDILLFYLGGLLMSSTLSEMSLEDLWELFPIFLEPHQAVWKEWYEEEASLLMGILPHRETMPVSYTHLDVYKRQPLAPLKSGGQPVMSL